ncbi:MAG: wax ester/triacylglycerol synthase family O-acyltransferase [Alphaproteobacteria bacterium]
MQQLSSIDSMFLYQELDNAPMHIAGLAIYDPSTANNGFVRFKDILRTYHDRLHLSPMFRRKLVQVPLNVDYPYWVEDADFDLEYHVRHIALPKPGDWRQLCILVARLHSRPLDLNRPLWEATIIEGLDNIPGLPEGSYAVLTKVHHAAIDTLEGSGLARALHTRAPEDRAAEPETPWRPERTPSAAELLARTYGNNIKSPLQMARVLSDAMPSVARMRAGMRLSEEKRSGKPKTRFNGAISAHRVFGAVDMPLDDIRAIRDKVEGATVNDVVVAIVAGGLRRYLEGKRELPTSSLVAGVPLNVRGENEDTSTNTIHMPSIEIHTDIADPLDRVRAVNFEMDEVGAYKKAVSAKAIARKTVAVPASLTALGSRKAFETALANRFDVPFNTIITNVPGPADPVYMTGAKMVRAYELSPIQESLGLTHSVFSYNGSQSITFQACREMLPDPDAYNDALQASFAEMRAAAGLAVAAA